MLQQISHRGTLPLPWDQAPPPLFSEIRASAQSESPEATKAKATRPDDLARWLINERIRPALASKTEDEFFDFWDRHAREFTRDIETLLRVRPPSANEVPPLLSELFRKALEIAGDEGRKAVQFAVADMQQAAKYAAQILPLGAPEDVKEDALHAMRFGMGYSFYVAGMQCLLFVDEFDIHVEEDVEFATIGLLIEGARLAKESAMAGLRLRGADADIDREQLEIVWPKPCEWYFEYLAENEPKLLSWHLADKSASPAIRALAAAAASSMLSAKDALQILEPALDDESAIVREGAIHGLEPHASDPDVRRALERLSEDREEFLREAALEALDIAS